MNLKYLKWVDLFFHCSYPHRLSDTLIHFGRSESMASRIFNTTLKLLYERYSGTVSRIVAPWTDLPALANAVAQQCTLKTCIGFIDGTLRGMCRPGRSQKNVYSGHKRKHGLKYQGVMLSNGLMCMHGPWAGRHHDSFLLAESTLLQDLDALPRAADGTRYCLYGDMAYPVLAQIIPPYKTSPLPADEAAFNAKMCTVRDSVEAGFGKILQNFAFLDFSKNQKLYLQPLAHYYVVGTLFTNCHTCLYGSSVVNKFNLSPPSLEDYLA